MIGLSQMNFNQYKTIKNEPCLRFKNLMHSFCIQKTPIVVIISIQKPFLLTADVHAYVAIIRKHFDDEVFVDFEHTSGTIGQVGSFVAKIIGLAPKHSDVFCSYHGDQSLVEMAKDWTTRKGIHFTLKQESPCELAKYEKALLRAVNLLTKINTAHTEQAYKEMIFNMKLIAPNSPMLLDVNALETHMFVHLLSIYEATYATF